MPVSSLGMHHHQTMSPKNVTVRLSPVLIERLDQLAAAVRHNPRLCPSGRMTRADLIRAALLKGCAALEAETAQPHHHFFPPVPVFAPPLPPLVEPVTQPLSFRQSELRHADEPIGDGMDEEFERY